MSLFFLCHQSPEEVHFKEEDEEKVRKSQLATSLFAGISTSTSSTSVKPKQDGLPSTQPPLYSLSTGVQRMTVEKYADMYTDRRSQSARTYAVQPENSNPSTLSSSCPVEDMPPMEFSVEPANHIIPSKPSSQRHQLQPGLSRSNQLNLNDEGAIDVEKSSARDLYDVPRDLDLNDPAAQNLLTASTLTSPVEFEGQTMYAGVTTNDLSPDDYVNVQGLKKDMKSKVVKCDSYHSSPCKSVGSIDTDSIEEG